MDYNSLGKELTEQSKEIPSSLLGKFRSILRYTYLSLSSKLNLIELPDGIYPIFLHSVFDDGIDSFKNFLFFLKMHGQIIGTQDLKKYSNKKGKFFHLSFDDGLENNFRNAVPILEELRIPCTFFIPTLCLKNSISENSFLAIEIMKYRKPLKFLNEKQIKIMSDKGFEIGSHGHSHRMLSELNLQEAYLELNYSKDILEKIIQKKVVSLSWPFGKKEAFSENLEKICLKSGYEYIYSGVRGKYNPDKNIINRHHFETWWPLDHFLPLMKMEN